MQTAKASATKVAASGMELCGNRYSLTSFMGQSRRDGSSGTLGGVHTTSVGL